MEILQFYLIILFSLLIFLSIGFLINYKLKVLNQNNIIDLTLFGYSCFVLLSFFSYFVLTLKSEHLLILILFFTILFLIKFYKFLKINSKFFKKYLFIISIFFSIFSLPLIIYGEQFYVFRGNYWDNFNYLSSAVLFSKFDFSYLRTIDLKNKFQNFQSIEGIILYRPYINYFLSLFLKFKIFDPFFTNFCFKIFLLILNFLAFISFLDIIKFISKNYKIFLSFVLSLSFFTIYILEIEALSHLGSISLFLFCIKYLYLVNLKFEKKNLIFLSISSAALFIIYPEIFIIYCLISFSYFISCINRVNFINLIKNLLVCSVIFIGLTIFSFEINYKFLLLQISQAFNSKIDWWTYFGAFIFGKDNLVLNLEYIQLIENNLRDKNLIKLIKMFYLDHLENGYKLIYLNIVPSLFGLYYMTVGKIENNTLYVAFFLLLSILNVYLITIVYKNIIKLLKSKNKFLLISLILILVLFLYLLLKGNFWTIIKLYSYCFPFIFLFLSLDFKRERLNILMVIMLIIFPIYKYSQKNNGIGKLDSFPSIINKDYKNNINWNLNFKKFKECKNVYTQETDYFIKAYINMKALFYDTNFVNLFDENYKKIYCKVNIEDKNYIVKIIND